MQIKKALLAGAIGAIMVGSTIAYAASLSDFPSPFVASGSSNYLVVVGSTAQPGDVAGAIDIAARLGGEATVTTSIPVTGGGTGAAVTNGIALDTANTKIRFADYISTAKDTLTKDDLPTLLATASVSDTSGNEFKFNQYIQIDNSSANRATFYRYKSTMDPDTILQMSTSAGNPLYIAKIVFEKPLNTTATNGKTIKIFGTEYTLGSGSEMSNTTLTLFGGGQEVELTGEWEHLHHKRPLFKARPYL